MQQTSDRKERALETFDEHGWLEDDPQPKTNFISLDFSEMSEDEILGHLLDTQGLIPHDRKRFSKIENDRCRIAMRAAEAFAFGYQMGKKEGQQ